MTNRTVISNEEINSASLCKNEQGQVVGGNTSAAFPDKSRIRTVRAPLE